MELRAWTLEDAPTLSRLGDAREIRRNLRDGFPDPFGPEAAARILAAFAANPRCLYRAIVEDGLIVGNIGVSLQDDVYRNNAELAYFLGVDYQGRGLGTRAIRMVCDLAFASFPGVTRIFAEPFASNLASRRALEKAGFSLEGILRRNVLKEGRVDDTAVYSLLREEWPGFPAPGGGDAGL